ncbi:MAG: outer membrane beta-barrel family protein, partial [Tannerellaceae bacterium]|nr:outer membrane beta-barrel family protein [Tannerellaceae bacterium]
YYNFQPTLGLYYRFSDKASFRYRLNIYNDVPALAQLTDADVPIDSLQIRRGNPALKPGMSYSNTALLDYSIPKLYLSFQAVHWYSSNFTQEKAFLEGNKVVRSYQNMADFQRLTFQFYSRLSLINDRFVLSANCGMHHFSAGSGTVYTVPYYYLNAQFNYKNWQLYAMLYDQGAGFTGEVKYIYGTGNYLGVQYSKKNCVFGILLSNMFTDAKMTTENISRIAPYTKNVYEKDKIYALSLRFTLNVDFGRKFNTRQQRISNSDSGTSNTLSTGK